jgi:hypothetical protein
MWPEATAGGPLLTLPAAASTVDSSNADDLPSRLVAGAVNSSIIPGAAALLAEGWAFCRLQILASEDVVTGPRCGCAEERRALFGDEPG